MPQQQPGTLGWAGWSAAAASLQQYCDSVIGSGSAQPEKAQGGKEAPEDEQTSLCESDPKEFRDKVRARVLMQLGTAVSRGEACALL